MLLKRSVARARDEVVFRSLLHPRKDGFSWFARDGLRSRWLGPNHSRASSTVDEVANEGTSSKAWDSEGGASPTSCSYTSNPETSVPRVIFICSKNENHFIGSCHRLVDSCARFVERVRNRLYKADVATHEWQALREKFAADLVKGETDDGHAEDELLANLPHPGGQWKVNPFSCLTLTRRQGQSSSDGIQPQT